MATEHKVGRRPAASCVERQDCEAEGGPAPPQTPGSQLLLLRKSVHPQEDVWDSDDPENPTQKSHPPSWSFDLRHHPLAEAGQESVRAGEGTAQEAPGDTRTPGPRCPDPQLSGGGWARAVRRRVRPPPGRANPATGYFAVRRLGIRGWSRRLLRGSGNSGRESPAVSGGDSSKPGHGQTPAALSRSGGGGLGTGPGAAGAVSGPSGPRPRVQPRPARSLTTAASAGVPGS